MVERRYTDEETAAIFKAAAELQQAALTAPGGGATSAGEGMTLAQLQAIGREVGIPSELVTRAAHGLEARARPSVRRFFGLPIGVGRTVALQRTLTDAEWERLVVDLRETFDARGRLHSDGGFRQWTNGNLQALLEPTPTGHQLRLRTMKSSANALITGGMATVAFGTFLFAFRSIGGGVGAGDSWVFIGATGVSMIALGALSIRGWAKRRQKQMEEIIARLTGSTVG